MASRRVSAHVLPWLSACVGAGAWFLLSTSALARAAGPVVLAAGLVGLGVASSIQVKRGVWARLGSGAVTPALGGVMAFWAAPALVLSQRSSDAPSGSEVLFFSVVAFAVITLAVAAAMEPSRPSLIQWASVVSAAIGAAALLANWERPSSFSPLVRWPEREVLMLVAGIVFAVGTVLVVRAENRHGIEVRGVAGLAAGAVGILAAIPSLASAGIGDASLNELILLAVAYPMFAAGWLSLARGLGMPRASSALVVVPVVLTALILAERLWGVRGPDPIVWSGAVPAMALCVAGTASLLFSRRPQEPAHPAETTISRVLLWAGLSAAAFSAVTLALPAISQSVDAVFPGTNEAFRAHWTVSGFQSASGWAAFAAGLCALAAAWAASRVTPVARWASVVAVGLVSAAALPFLGETTFGSWNSWVPGEIQHAYGTEYARMTVSAILHPARVASAVVSVSVLALSVVHGLSARGAIRSGGRSEARS